MPTREAYENHLSRALGTRVSVVITNNSWSVLRYTAYDRGARVTVRLHRIFLDAPEPVVDAIVHWARRPRGGAPPVIDHYIFEHQHGIRGDAPPALLDPRGQTHDLAAIYRTLESRYFDRPLHCSIGFAASASSRRGSRRTIQFGAYDAVHRSIRIHPVLDRPWIDATFVSYIVYHEMLHATIPVTLSPSGRRIHHPPEFRARERQFEYYKQARLFEKKNISRILRESRSQKWERS
jgi:hypothetical protein